MDDYGHLNRDLLLGRRVCATGRLYSMTHSQLAELVRDCGGVYARWPARGDNLIVIGDDGWPAEHNGSPGRVFDRALELRQQGHAVEFAAEADFLEQLGLTEPAGALRGRHTICDLARILDVSPSRIRRWMRVGLVEPIESVHRLAYFDFHQVAFARRLCELLEGGTTLAAIREGLEQARAWLPTTHLPLPHLARLEHDGRILLRLNDALLDVRGQRYFDFDSTTLLNSSMLVVPQPASNLEAAWHFDQGVNLEDAGQFDEAAAAYGRAAALEPRDPVLQFNWGNVLFELGRQGEATERFRAAVALDPDYAEAWNNLGNALAAEGELAQAADALRRAVQLVPGYGDAHYNLARVLDRQGKQAEAASHRRSSGERWQLRVVRPDAT